MTKLYTITVFTIELRRINQDDRNKLNTDENFRQFKLVNRPCNCDCSDYTLKFNSKQEAYNKYNELLKTLHSDYYWGNNIYNLKWVTLELECEDDDGDFEFIETLEYDTLTE